MGVSNAIYKIVILSKEHMGCVEAYCLELLSRIYGLKYVEGCWFFVNNTKWRIPPNQI